MNKDEKNLVQHDEKQTLTRKQAELHFNLAIKIEASAEMKGEESAEESLQIMDHLFTAIDNGSARAADKFIDRLKGRKMGEFWVNEISFKLATLKMIADGGNPFAARVFAHFLAGQLYSGNPYPGTENHLPTPREKRAELAIAYLEQARKRGYDSARIDLCDAYKGFVGCIKYDAVKWKSLHVSGIEELQQRPEFEYRFALQKRMLQFGAELCGFYAHNEHKVTPAELKLVNLQQGLEYLFHVTRGIDIKLATQALKIIIIAQLQNTTKVAENLILLRDKFIKEACTGNEVIALYLARYSVPRTRQQVTSDLFSVFGGDQLPELEAFEALVAEDEKTQAKVVHYLEQINAEQSSIVRKVAAMLHFICTVGPAVAAEVTSSIQFAPAA